MRRSPQPLLPIAVYGERAWLAPAPITALNRALDGALVATHISGESTRFDARGLASPALEDDPTPDIIQREARQGARLATIDTRTNVVSLQDAEDARLELPSLGHVRRWLAWAPDASALAVATTPGFVELWDLPAGTLRWQRFLGGQTYALIWDDDGLTLRASVGHRIVALDPATGLRRDPHAHVTPPRHLSFTRDRSALLSSSGCLDVCEIDPHTLRWPLDDLASPTAIEAVFALDSPAGLLTASDHVALASRLLYTPRAASDEFFWRGVSALAAPEHAPLGLLCAIALHGKGSVLSIDLSGAAQHTTLYQHRERAPRLIALSPNAQRLAIGAAGRDLVLCDPASGATTHTLSGLVRFPDALAWRDDATLAAFGLDGRLAVWSPDQSCKPRWSDGKLKARALAWDGDALLVADHVGALHVLDADTGAKIARYPLDFIPRALLPAPDGTLFAAGEDTLLYHLPSPR